MASQASGTTLVNPAVSGLFLLSFSSYTVLLQGHLADHAVIVVPLILHNNTVGFFEADAENADRTSASFPD